MFIPVPVMYKKSQQKIAIIHTGKNQLASVKQEGTHARNVHGCGTKCKYLFFVLKMKRRVSVVEIEYMLKKGGGVKRGINRT